MFDDPAPVPALNIHRLTLAGQTHQGLVRAHNEDAFFLRESDGLFAIADGLGGYRHGGFCSRMAINHLAQNPALLTITDSGQIAQAIEDCNLALINHQKTSKEHQGMRTTMTCAAVTPENKLLYAWAGDSRIYRFSHRDGLLQLTRDHTLLEEKNQTGRRASPSDAHILTKSLGGNQVFEAANGHLQLEKDDLVLLTTDGLTSVVSDHDIETALRAAHTDLETTAVSLIDLALSGGGPDNITALLCRVQTD
ncbi:MAG: PP2C family protein-serine/threonine phosphatase [Candidatus Azotimanducaceae bacterium]